MLADIGFAGKYAFSVILPYSGLKNKLSGGILRLLYEFLFH
jgi:hypothetical protein